MWGCSHNIYTSPAIQSAWCHVTWREHFYGHLMLPPTTKHTWVFMWSDWHFCPLVTKFGFSQHIFMRILNIKFHRNPSSESCADTCRQMDMTKPKGTFWNYMNASKNQRIVAQRNNSSIVNKRLNSDKYYKRNCLLVLCNWQQKTK